MLERAAGQVVGRLWRLDFYSVAVERKGVKICCIHIRTGIAHCGSQALQPMAHFGTASKLRMVFTFTKGF